MKKIILSAVLLLFASVCSFGQGAAVAFPGVTNPQGQPVPGVQLHFCAAGAVVTSGVCAPTVTVYHDSALTNPWGSAITTDGLGNFPEIWFTPGNYCYSISGFPAQTNTCEPFSAPIVTGSSPSFTSVNLAALGFLCWNGDTGFTRVVAAQLDLGNCTPGDISGVLNLNTVSAFGAVNIGFGAALQQAGANQINIRLNGVKVWTFEPTGTGLRGGSGQPLTWSSNADPDAAVADTGISRTAAKTMAIGNGTQGDSTGTVKVENAVVANFDSVLWVDGIKYTTLAGCYAGIPSAGGVCHIPPGYTETLAASVTMNKNGAGFQFEGPAVITMGSNQFVVSAGASGAFIAGPMDDGGQLCSALPCTTYTNSTELIYTGNSAAIVVGAATPQTQHAKIRGLFINLAGAGNAAIGIDVIATAGHFDISQNLIVGSGGAPNTQIGILLDGGGTTFTCDGEIDENEVINTFIGIKTANMSCENVYKGNQIAIVPGVPANSICVDFEDNSFGNSILGGKYSGCTTVWKVAGTGSANYGQFPINSETNDANFGAGTSGNMMLYFGQAGASNAVPVVTDTGTNNTVWSPNGLKISGAGLIRTYGGIATTNNGVADFVGGGDFTGQTANIGATPVYAVPAAGAGMYRVSFYEIVTTVAGVSSTLPNVLLSWTDPTNNTAQNPAILLVNNGNTLTTVQALVYNIDVKASTNIQISTTGYASNPATTMQYKLRVRVEKMD